MHFAYQWIWYSETDCEAIRYPLCVTCLHTIYPGGTFLFLQFAKLRTEVGVAVEAFLQLKIRCAECT